MSQPECFVCVDVETAGPNPSQYALLSLGAVLLDDPAGGFYAELKPTTMASTPEAEAVHGLSLETLAESGLDPAEALQQLEAWLQAACGGRSPVFVAFNAPFDWMFVADYFHRFLGRNPFGHRALDMKALYMGLHGGRWEDTSFYNVSSHYNLPQSLPHNALEDARQTALLLAAMFAEMTEETL